LSAAVTLLLKNLLLFDNSSFITVGPTGSADNIRCELVDGLLIIVITKRSSGDDEILVLGFAEEILRCEDVFILELDDTIGEDAADAASDRFSFSERDLTLVESFKIRNEVDCVRYRELK
jgi:hypothetical protein